MKKFLKKFPLTAYSVSAALLSYYAMTQAQYQYDDIYPIFFLVDPMLWIFVLCLPLVLVSQIYTFLNIQASLPWVIPIFFLLDLLIFSIRTGSLKNFLKKTYKKLFNSKHHNQSDS